jgi:hypothetical protein
MRHQFSIATLVATFLASSTASAAVWQPAAPLPDAVAVSAIALDDGHVFATYRKSATADGVFVYDPTADKWRAESDAPDRCDLVLPTITSGVYPAALCVVFGATTRTYLWSSVTHTWSATGAFPSAGRRSTTAVALSDGGVLIAGGTEAGSPSRRAELYDPLTFLWRRVADLPGAVEGAHAVRLLDQRVLVMGGTRWRDPSPTYFYDRKTDAWSTASAPPPSGLSIGALLITDYGMPVALAADSKGSGRPLAIDTKTGAHTPLPFEESEPLVHAESAGQNRLLLQTKSSNTYLLDVREGTTRIIPAPLGEQHSFVFTRRRVLALGTQVAALFQEPDDSPCTNPEVCASLGCYAGRCSNKCSMNADCATGSFCEAGACVLGGSLGSACTQNKECAAGNCLDGTCCSGDAVSCGAYACSATSCVEGCTKDDQCARGNLCVMSKCRPLDGSVCSADDAQSIPNDSSKAPVSCNTYRCAVATGTCPSSCTTDDHCAKGYSCVSRRCVETPAGGDDRSDEGGCVLGARSGSTPPAFFAMLAAVCAIGVVRRRREDAEHDADSHCARTHGESGATGQGTRRAVQL